MAWRRLFVVCSSVLVLFSPFGETATRAAVEPTASKSVPGQSQAFVSSDCKYMLYFWQESTSGPTGNLSYITAMPGDRISLQIGTMSNLVPDSLRSLAPPGTTNWEVDWCNPDTQSCCLGTPVTNQVISLDLDGDGNFETDSTRATTIVSGEPFLRFTAPARSNLFYPIFAKWQTPVGETIVATIKIFVDVDCGVSIDNGAEYTRSRQVRLTINPCPGASTVRVSNDGGFKDFITFSTASVVDWTIPSSRTGTFTKVLYAKYVGLPGGANSDDIILDTTAPSLGETSIARTGVSSAAIARQTKVKITTNARDTISGVKYIEVSNKKGQADVRLPYKKVVQFTSKASMIYVRVVDKAGNASPWRGFRTP